MKMDNVEDIYKLSPIQSGMLFHAISEPQSNVYFGQYCCTLKTSAGNQLDIKRFQQAWEIVVQRHSALRTIFLWEKVKQPLQIVRQTVDLPWELYDWQDKSATEQKNAIDQYLIRDQQLGFELTQAPLLRFALIQLTPQNSQFIWSTHHLILDGWSTMLVINEVISVYEQLFENRQLELEPARPYSEYIAWSQQQDLDNAEIYWRETLAGFTQTTLLPIRSEVSEDSNYCHQSLYLSADTTQALGVIARNNRLTLNTLVQGAWAILLARYTRQQDIIFGVTMAGRPADLAGSDTIVGLFINTLPARIKVSPDQSIQRLLSTIQRQQATLSAYQSTPLAKVQQWSELPAGESLFESIVVFENYPIATIEESALDIGNIVFTEHSNYPISLLVFPDRTYIQFKVVHDRAIFSVAVIERLSRHFQSLLSDMATSIDKSVSELNMLTEQEKVQFAQWNEPISETPAALCIHQLIQAHSQSESIAVVGEGGRSISYLDLHVRANQLAHALQNMGVGDGALVGLCINRSIDMIVGILGILKAGGAYVPLDPRYPAPRLAMMLSNFADANTVMVTHSSLVSLLAGNENKVICLDVDLQSQAVETPKNNCSVKDAAYMIYTSGSTGSPKGVLVSHQNIVSSTLARMEYYPETLEAFLLLSSFSFDSSMVAIFWSLTQGKTLVLPEPGQEKDIEALVDLIEKYRVSHTLCVPSLYQLFLRYAEPRRIGSLLNVIVAGEACSMELVDQHYQILPNATLYNEYGPTEATVWSTVSRLKPRTPITIGRPICNTQIYILDEQLNQVAIGVAGEVYIGGEGVALGYYNLPEETSLSFVENPVSADVKRRCYRTGDLARYLPDGQIVLMGRFDQQVKVNGYRIELREIQGCVNQYQDISASLVMVKNQQLTAYIQTDKHVLIADLSAHIAKRLPDYMVPKQIVEVDDFPLLPNGKIDHQALLELEAAPLVAPINTGFIEPRNEVEQILADIWADVLGLDSISINDHFLQIGGDSILSIQIIARARQAGLYFTPNDLFEHPEIGLLAQIIEIQATPDCSQIQDLVEGEVRLTPIQSWFFETIKPIPHHWNQAVQLTLPALLTAAQIHDGFDFICQHHDALRMRFTSSPDSWEQFNQGANFQLPWSEIDLRDGDPDQYDEIIAEKADQIQANLNFSTSLLHIAFFHLNDEKQNRVLLICHHLIVDQVSWNILLEDLEQLCEQLLAKEPLQLPNKTLSYQDWAKQLTIEAKGDSSKAQLSQWQDYLRIPTVNLPIDYPENRHQNIEEFHQIAAASLSQNQTQVLLQGVADTYQTKTTDILLTALLLTLHDWTDQANWLIDMELHGRDAKDLDLSRTVGWFTRFFPVALQMKETATGALIKSVKEQLRTIPQQGRSYGVLRYLSGHDELAEINQAEILFNYLGNISQASAKHCQIITDAKSGGSRSLRNTRSHLVEINVVISQGELIAYWSYCTSLTKQSTIKALADAFIVQLQNLIEHCQLPEAGGYTPSDFSSSGLDQNQLDQLIGSVTNQ